MTCQIVVHHLVVVLLRFAGCGADPPRQSLAHHSVRARSSAHHLSHLSHARSLLRCLGPPFRPFLIDEERGIEFNLRLCECRKDYKELKGEPGVCRCNGLCPAFVDPAYLTAAAGQNLCSVYEKTGYKCYAECSEPGNSEIKWFATPCGGPAQEECDPILKKPPPQAEAPATKAAAIPEAAPKPVDPPADANANPNEVVDLRGLQCELLNGKEQCFYEDAQGRELCPESITSEYLNSPKDQWSCQPENADKFFCTVGCQEGNPEVRWGANEIAWCNSNRGACTPKPSVIPKAKFTLRPWSGVPDPVLPCQERAKTGEKPPIIPELTVGLLTHEPKSMRDSLATYEAMGLFDVVGEFLIYVNKRRPEVDVELDPYVKKYPGKVRVMGDDKNYGIARAMTFLTGNASQPYFLFLERDFQLIEPSTCVYDQLTSGIELIKQKKAHVVRYRHKLHPGRPNWAERMFKGKEDDVFKGHQPNLFCNHVRRDGLYVDKLVRSERPLVAVLLVPGAAQTLAGQDLAVLRQASVSLLGFILLQLGMELFIVHYCGRFCHQPLFHVDQQPATLGNHVVEQGICYQIRSVQKQ